MIWSKNEDKVNQRKGHNLKKFVQNDQVNLNVPCTQEIEELAPEGLNVLPILVSRMLCDPEVSNHKVPYKNPTVTWVSFSMPEDLTEYIKNERSVHAWPMSTGTTTHVTVSTSTILEWIGEREGI